MFHYTLNIKLPYLNVIKVIRLWVKIYKMELLKVADNFIKRVQNIIVRTVGISSTCEVTTKLLKFKEKVHVEWRVSIFNKSKQLETSYHTLIQKVLDFSSSLFITNNNAFDDINPT